MTNSVTGNSVASGGRGVIVKQIGSLPATYRVRFDGLGGLQQSLILDDVTDNDIEPTPVAVNATHCETVRDVYRWTASAIVDRD